MQTRKRVLGDEHPDTLTSMENLAVTYESQGRWKEAEELQVQEMQVAKRVLSDEHASTCITLLLPYSTADIRKAKQRALLKYYPNELP
jgi:hypothetical protein